MGDFPRFEEFYRAIYRRAPLPWQSALAERVIAQGWPAEIGIPTGLGKTACIDVALWALAREADVEPRDRVLPTRIWYVVNRRILVNDAFTHATRVAQLLLDAVDPDYSGPDSEDHLVLRSVGLALRQRAGVSHRSGPLFVSELRGGMSRRELPPDPSMPSIVCSTVPMFGSRLLFRGYGGGSGVRPVQTALAAVDSLVLLDEAHLSQPLQTVVGHLAEADRAAGESVLQGARSNAVLVAVTATGSGNDRFDLTDADFGNPVVQQRLRASKPTIHAECRKTDFERTLAQALVDGLSGREDPAAAVVFVNSPRHIAKLEIEVRAALKRAGIDADVSALTGRIRGGDAEVVVRSLDELRSGRTRAGLATNRVVLATQTLEVGADLDFDVLVTQLAGIRALTQRFGRLNRTGDPDCVPFAAIVRVADAADDPLYGDEVDDVWQRLNDAGDVVDLCPVEISRVLGQSDDPGPRSPELLPNHLDEWVKTSSVVVGEAPVELFINGMSDRLAPRCSVAWRANATLRLTKSDRGDTAGKPSKRGLPKRPNGSDSEDGRSGRAIDRLLPSLRSDELVEVPIAAVRELLEKRDLDAVWRVNGSGVGLELVPIDRVRDGDTVVLESGQGGYRREGLVFDWDPVSADAVSDLSLGRAGSVDLNEALWLDASSALQLAELMGEGSEEWHEVMKGLLASSGFDGDDATEADEVAAHLLLLPQTGQHPSETRLARRLRWMKTGWWLAPVPERFDPWASPDADQLDELSIATRSDDSSISARSDGLFDHLGSVGAVAEQIALQMGLPSVLVESTRSAGLLHDLGKCEPRFQRMLTSNQLAGRLLAKSGTSRERWAADRVAAMWPSGGRHEALSARIISEPETERLLAEVGLLSGDVELVQHLVASHHGNGRPGAIGVADDCGSEFPVPLRELLDALAPGAAASQAEGSVVCDGDLSESDWGQPTRFARLNRKYGRRGLALLEAVVRQADWAASASIESSRKDQP